jgi:formiminotetrahydrofolate cyclodeaminase
VLPVANENLVSDVAAATAAARAAASTARLAVEANLSAIDDDDTAELVRAVALADDLARRADEVEAEVRGRMRR